MSDPGNKTEDQLRDALRARVDHGQPVRTPLGDVVSTAHGIRRRRRVTTGVLAGAAVVAFAVPAAVVVHLDRSTAPTPASSGPTSSSTSTPSPSPSPTPGSTAPAGVALADLPVGHAPRISYVENADFLSAEGNRTTLPVAGSVLSATPYHGGFLVATSGGPGQTTRVVLLDNTLHQVWARCGADTFGLSGDQLMTAFVTAHCHDTLPATVTVGISSGMGDSESTAMLQPRDQVPVGVLPDGSPVTSALPDLGGWVDHTPGSPTRIPGLGRVAGVSPDGTFVSGQLTDQTAAGAVVDLGSGQVVWQQPGWTLERFSPDGTQVLGVRSEQGAITAWAVFDAASGKLLHQADLPGGYAAVQVAWEDDAHLLLNVLQDRTSALVRSDLAGHLERATAVQPDAGHYVIAPRP